MGNEVSSPSNGGHGSPSRTAQPASASAAPAGPVPPPPSPAFLASAQGEIFHQQRSGFAPDPDGAEAFINDFMAPLETFVPPMDSCHGTS